MELNLARAMALAAGMRVPDVAPACRCAGSSLTTLFLRRYLTCCARRRRYAANARCSAIAS